MDDAATGCGKDESDNIRAGHSYLALGEKVDNAFSDGKKLI